MPNRAPKTLEHIRKFWKNKIDETYKKLNLNYKNYLPMPMVFCLNSNTMAERIVKYTFFPYQLRDLLKFEKTLRIGKKMVDKLFNTLERCVSSKFEYKKFQKSCVKSLPFGATKYPEPVSVPNLHRFFKYYALLGKKEKKELRV